MKFTDNPFMILFGIVSIAVGIVTFFDKRIANIQDLRVAWVFLGLAVIIVLIVFMGRTREPVGLLILSFFLGFVWAINFFHLNFSYRDLILGIIPIAAGLFMLMGL